MPNKLICPQCQENKILLELYIEEGKKFHSVSMCKQCYNYYKKTKNLFRKTSAA